MWFYFLWMRGFLLEDFGMFDGIFDMFYIIRINVNIVYI